MIPAPIMVKVIPIVLAGWMAISSLSIPFQIDSHWWKGDINGYHWEGKIYDTPSKYGINNGRISKLRITDNKGNTVINYDRGWDKAPVTPEEQKLVNIVTTKFDGP